jgi:hypothetical protein
MHEYLNSFISDPSPAPPSQPHGLNYHTHRVPGNEGRVGAKDRQIDRQTERKIDGRRDGQTVEQTDKQTDGRSKKDVCTDGRG